MEQPIPEEVHVLRVHLDEDDALAGIGPARLGPGLRDAIPPLAEIGGQRWHRGGSARAAACRVPKPEMLERIYLLFLSLHIVGVQNDSCCYQMIVFAGHWSGMGHLIAGWEILLWQGAKIDQPFSLHLS